MTHIHDIELFIYVLFAVYFIGFMLPALLVPQARIRRLYATYCQPPIAPGPVVFSIVWTIMYLLSAIAYTRIRLMGEWVSGGNATALTFFVILMVWLMLWAPTFIWGLWFAAIQTLVALALSIAVTIMFWRLDTTAGILMGILSLWLLFAMILQWWMAFLNRSNVVEPPPCRSCNGGVAIVPY